MQNIFSYFWTSNQRNIHENLAVLKQNRFFKNDEQQPSQTYRTLSKDCTPPQRMEAVSSHNKNR